MVSVVALDAEGHDIGGRWPEHENQLDPDSDKLLLERVQKPTPLPKLQLSVLLYMQLAEPVTTHVMLPFIVQLVKETGITGGDITKVGYYVGLTDSLYYFSEALTALQWGRLSDRIGRRPVLLAGLCGLALSTVLFGLSHTFWAVVASRVISGALNGNKGVTKCMLGDITDETNVAQAFSLVPLTWAIGATIAPLIGGMLQHPYERLGGVFHHEFWRKNPYFLPCVIPAFMAPSGFLLAFFFLKETAPCRTARRVRGVPEQGARDSEVQGRITERSPFIPTITTAQPSPTLRSLLTPRVLTAILNVSLASIIDEAFYILLPLVLSTPIENGGLGMSPALLGTCLAGSSIASGTINSLLFAPLTRKLGTKRLATACMASFLGSFCLFPLMNALARVEGRITPLVWMLFFLQLSLTTLPPMAFSCIFIYLTSATPSRSTLGAVNGLAHTTISIMRAVGPVGGTSLFALSIQRNLLGGNLVYAVICSFVVAGIMATRLLPEKPWDRPDEYQDGVGTGVAL